MRIATWNVNSVRARLANIIDWLHQEEPDVILMQEIKCETLSFPLIDFKTAGYEVYVFGQKSYNGVAIASRHPLSDVKEGLPGDDDDIQARYLEATVKNVRLASIYLPNGNPVGTEKYIYKTGWMTRLKMRAQKLLETEMPIVLGGDFNIIPDSKDAYNPDAWIGDALYLPQSRAAFRNIIQLGYTDFFRSLHPDMQAFSFWDYQAGAWQRDDGIRIDHFLLSPEAVDLGAACRIDRSPRGKEKASDHAPVILELSL